MRPAALSGRCAVRPLVHRRPKLLGCCLSPLILLTLPSTTDMTMQHPTPHDGLPLRTPLLRIDLSPARMNETSAGRPGLLEQEGQHGAFVVKRMWAIGVDGLDGRAAAKGGPVGGRGCEACFGAVSRPS